MERPDKLLRLQQFIDAIGDAKLVDWPLAVGALIHQAWSFFGDEEGMEERFDHLVDKINDEDWLNELEQALMSLQRIDEILEDAIG